MYRLWRDGGFAIGALLAGILADLAGIRTATLAVAALTAASGLYAWRRLYETAGTRGRTQAAAAGTRVRSHRGR